MLTTACNKDNFKFDYIVCAFKKNLVFETLIATACDYS